MATIMRDKVLNLASRQVGYREEYINCTKYSRYFDNEAWQWFNTKKNGNPSKKVAGTEWCAIFVCWLFCQNEIIGPKKARVFLGCPAPKNNCAAGVPYLWDYLKARKWQVDKKSGVAGDIVFFNTSKAKCAHVGIIESVDAKAYHTIEGNKSNQVKRCTYTKTSTTIYGIMRPAWSEIEPKEEKPIETTPVKPEPVEPKYWICAGLIHINVALIYIKISYLFKPTILIGCKHLQSVVVEGISTIERCLAFFVVKID